MRIPPSVLRTFPPEGGRTCPFPLRGKARRCPATVGSAEGMGERVISPQNIGILPSFLGFKKEKSYALVTKVGLESSKIRAVEKQTP